MKRFILLFTTVLALSACENGGLYSSDTNSSYGSSSY